MVKGTTTKQKALTREVLVKELRAFEKRVDHKFDVQTESFKAHIDSRFAHVNERFIHIDSRFEQIDIRFTQIEKIIGDVRDKVNNLETKIDVSVAGLVEMLERNNGELVGIEKRLTMLERKN